MQPKTCTECKDYPVRKYGSYLCVSCFEMAMRDLSKREKPCLKTNETK